MKKKKVYVLVRYGRVLNSETPLMDIIGVYTTKTAAKVRMMKAKETERELYSEEFPYEEVEEYGESNIYDWGIQLVNDCPVFTELLIVEKEIDNDED